MKFQVSSFKFQVTRRNPAAGITCNLQPATCNRPRGFTLVELLVVISILGILVALTVPALKNLGKSNIAVSASRQLLDDVGRARQLAISQRTTVYMVFVPTNFWGSMDFTKLTTAQLTVLTNLIERQLTGYNFISLGALGDQPGNHQWKYLSDWHALPDNSFIASWKFIRTGVATRFTIPTDNDLTIYPFDETNNIPFPTADSAASVSGYWPMLPYIAFDYQGRLVSSPYDSDRAGSGAIIPLAQGNVAYGKNGTTKTPAFTPVAAADITETPPGNSTNIGYNVIHVDPLTGRSSLEFFKLK